jgi:hypothetical protein
MHSLARTAAVAVLAVIGFPLDVAASQAARAERNPCAAPTEIGPNIDETAWRLWVAATCPVNANQYPYLVWEDWIEQAQMYPADPKQGLVVPNAGAADAGHQLHSSPLALRKHPQLAKIIKGLLGAPNEKCNQAAAPPPNQPKLVICEEVRLNGGAEDYIAGNNLWNRPGQAEKAAYYSPRIQFPAPAIEIKADWIDLTSIGLKCSRLPPGFTKSIHVETIDGNCFGLAGISLISKLLNQWIWTTFEPQNATTNPLRCRVLGCIDTFGSSPPATRGADTRLTAPLLELMNAALLAPEWKNYRLDGVQIGFYRPELLGNSIIEGENVGMPLTQSSCITCHALSSIKSDGTDGITLLTSNPVGAPAPLPSRAWVRRDFVWSLLEACPDSGGQTCAPAH